MNSERAQDVDCELTLGVEDGEIKTMQFLLLRTQVQLLLLGDGEDVGHQEGLFGDGQRGVLVEPGELSLAKNTPLALELFLTS